MTNEVASKAKFTCTCFKFLQLKFFKYFMMFMLNQVCSSFEESKSFVFVERLEVLAVAGVL